VFGKVDTFWTYHGAAVELDREHMCDREEEEEVHGLRLAAGKHHEEHVDGKQAVTGTRVTGGDAVPLGRDCFFNFVCRVFSVNIRCKVV
jgi:hypothetical protein